MKLYVQYYHWSTGYGNDGVPKPIEKPGTDGRLPLDGRFNRASQKRAAEHYASRFENKPCGYVIHRNDKPISEYISLIRVTSFMKNLAEAAAKAQERDMNDGTTLSEPLIKLYVAEAKKEGFEEVRWPGLYPQVKDRSGHWQEGY